LEHTSSRVSHTIQISSLYILMLLDEVATT
jgi:hypothetical protein